MEKKKNKGRLIYSSPECSLGVRIQVSAIYLFFLSGAIILTVGYILIDPQPLGILLPILGVVIVLIFANKIIAGELYPHYRIYENGITPNLEHNWHPFGDCGELEHRVSIINRLSGGPHPEIIYWDEIACFEIIASETEKRPVLYVHLKSESEVNPSPRKDHPIRFGFSHGAPYYTKQMRKDSQETMENIIKQLKEHGIPEIPFKCEHCGKKARPPLRVCPNCGERRF